MKIAAHRSTTKQEMLFQYQSIVDSNAANQSWIEMFYRPQHLLKNSSVEHFFKSLTPQLKIDLDLSIFNQIPKVIAQNQPERLSINLMPISLISHVFKAKLRTLIDKRLIDPNKLCIEIIEIHSMSPLDLDTLEFLKYFRSHGGWIALDDFGSGFAHWELLQMGLIDVIKVANQNWKRNRKTDQFTQGLAAFANSMKIATVLEGVETKQDYELGLEQGFKNFQGWHFDKTHAVNGHYS